MKKKFIYSLLLPLLLISACGGATSSEESPSSSEESPSSSEETTSSQQSTSESISESTSSEEESSCIAMEDDPATNYPFEMVSNENGSMSYEIFTRSFYDASGNGIGDFDGITYQLDYLKDMGIKTLWLTPIHPSPTYHGYDVKDYFAVSPALGSLDTFDNLVNEANKRNIDIMLDMVFNHCSRENQIFIDSYNDFKMYGNEPVEGSKATWFNWSDTAGGIYNARYQNDSNAWYEARFDSSMPDFNFDNEEVKDYIESIMKFWIVDHGVKGFRLDAVKYYYYENTKLNNEVLTWMEETAHKYDPNFYMVGECWSADGAVNMYHGSKLDSFFRFEGSYQGGGNGISSITNMAKGSTRANKFADAIVKNVSAIHEKNPDAYPSYFLSNHDMDRSSHAFKDNLDAMKMASSILAFMPGTPFMYYGEEIGMVGKRKTSPDDLSDVKRRLPMVWSENDKTGECIFPESNRQDLNTTDQVDLGVYDRLEENFSLLNHYRYVNQIRNQYPFLKHADITSLVDDLNTESTKVVAFKLYQGDDYIIVVHNCANEPIEVSVDGDEILDQINTTHKIPTLENNLLTLGAYSSVVIK